MDDASLPLAQRSVMNQFRATDLLLPSLVLFNFAIAQPLLDVVGRSPVFFAAHGFSRWDIVLFALGLTILLPGFLALGALVAWRLHRTAGYVIHFLIVCVLAGLLALQVLKRIVPANWLAVMLGGALILGIGVAILHQRTRRVRRFFHLSSPAPVIVLAVFLFLSPANQVIFSGSSFAGGEAVRVENPAPIVFIVFDEVQVVSLMAPDGTIDGALFPNFASLAADGIWFRNARTVHNFTSQAVPAILSGRYPSDGFPGPFPVNHPNTLFSLLASTYEINAIETATLLCREDICGGQDRPPAVSRWNGFVKDMQVVSQHVLLPERMTRRLPPVDEALGHFADDGAPEGDDRQDLAEQRDQVREQGPVALWRQFVESIEPSVRPPLFFHHTLLTHVAGKYLPSGERYSGLPFTPGREGIFWIEDEWLTTQAEQRQILQLMYADRLLGDVLDRLRDVELYDDSLIVVTSDHGTSFRPGTSLRYLTEETMPDITGVPLLIKRPGERTGAIDDRPVETVDIVPSIADVLGIDLPHEVDGKSVYREGRLRTVNRAMHSTGEGRERETGEITYRANVEDLLVLLQRKTTRFGPGLRDLYEIAPGPYRDLIGTTVAGERAADPTVFLERSRDFQRVRLGGDRLPAFVRGRLSGAGPGPHILAIGINSLVRAVTRTFVRDGETLFTAIVPPYAFRDGANAVDVLLVDPAEPRGLLRLVLEE